MVEKVEQMSSTNSNLLTIKDAAEWATNYLGRLVTNSNIQYLIQYAKIKRHLNENTNLVDINELRNYYKLNLEKQEIWKKNLGTDLDWSLSFSHLRESDTTKHVHRLHPYKGKFIPQLVEYFLDEHLNHHKKEIFFKKGDIVLDPFAGSGTTLVQAAELGLHSIGIDVSEFNCLISEVKLGDYNKSELDATLKNAMFQTLKFSNKIFDKDSYWKLREKLNEFNEKYFPDPEFKNSVRKGEEKYAEEKLSQFLKENKSFLENSKIKDGTIFQNEKESNFLSKWFSDNIRQELFYYSKLINKENDIKIKNVMKIILSRTARSCRSTTHSDLATLREPQAEPYYCQKHNKICMPINTITTHLRRYTYDTIDRLHEFSNLKKRVFSSIIHGDSRDVNIFEKIRKQNPEFYKLLASKKVDGIFTSPPYVGNIDYHEQHAYAYELFNIPRIDDKEIGPLFKGQGKQARDEYVESISKVLINIRKFLKDDGNFFIVANDKYDLYPIIAEKSGLKIVNKFKRPVLNRTERDRQPYAEIIFHMKNA